MLSDFPLQRFVKQLAINCQLESRSGDEWYLTLPGKFKFLLRWKDALAKTLGIQINIRVTDVPEETTLDITTRQLPPASKQSETDDWHKKIVAYLKDKENITTQTLVDSLGLKSDKVIRNRVANVLRTLGWRTDCNFMIDGKRCKGWRRG